MKYFILLLVCFTLSQARAVDNPASLEFKQLMDKELKDRQAAEDEYHKNHPNYAYTVPYLEFQITAKRKMWDDRIKISQDLCTKFKTYCQDEAEVKKEIRHSEHYVNLIKDRYNSYHLREAGKITKEEGDRLHEAKHMHFLQSECNSPYNIEASCKGVEEYKLKYKTKFGKDYDPNEKFPELVYPDAEVNPKTEEVKTEVKEEPKEEVVDPRNYNSSTCVWASDMPRRIVQGPGCSTAGNQVCVGYVVCEQKTGGGKFIRMSTCGDENCGEGDAVACTKQGGYSSRKPKDETKNTVTKELKTFLTNGKEQ